VRTVLPKGPGDELDIQSIADTTTRLTASPDLPAPGTQRTAAAGWESDATAGRAQPDDRRRARHVPSVDPLPAAHVGPDRVTAEIVLQLFDGAPASIAANVIIALICVFAERHFVPMFQLAGWLLPFLALTAGRAWLVRAYRRAPVDGALDCRVWLRHYRTGMVGSGMMWGLAGVLLFPATDVLHQMMLTAILLGVSAAVVVSSAVDAFGASVYAAAVILPFCARMFVREGDLYTSLGMLGVVYLGFIGAVIRELARRALENLTLRLDAVRSEEALTVSTDQYRLLLDHLPVGVLHYDGGCRVTYCSERLAQILHTSRERLVGLDLGQVDDGAIVPLLRRMLRDGNSVTFEGYHNATLGPLCGWIRLNATPSRNARGGIVGGIAIVEDVTESHANQEEILRLGLFDSLTGLPNRRWLLDRLRQVVVACERTAQFAALLYIDLDNFKTINDTRGYEVGDELLKQVAARLVGSVRSSDSVVRLGGDEFLVLLENLRGSKVQASANAGAVGETMRATLNEVFHLDAHDYYCTPSIGIYLFGDQPAGEDEVLKRADAAMYQAKEAGRNTMRFFDPRSQHLIAEQSALEVDLRAAIRDRQFVLHYQPVVDRGRKVAGAEALVRWNHPARGLVQPAAFIGAAETSGLIVPLGRWVLEAACQQLARWARQPHLAGLSLAVNVSALQVRQADFVDDVMAIVEQCGADPHRLKLELTESLFVDDVDGTSAKMNALSSCGIGFSLDDFGTGYSSLSHLKRLPLDLLKIDRSFVSHLESDASDASICAATIGLAHNLGVKVVAEGVETAGQCAFLSTQHDCDYMQGYFFSEPLPLDAFESYMGQHQD